MYKNTAGQSTGAQMVNASTGAPFSGSVLVYVTGDNGTQALGGTGSGVCTHEGNGYYSYRPTQAETNYNHIAFTYVGTGALPITVQLYTDQLGGEGTGARTCTITVDDGTDPLENATVRMTQAGVSYASGSTDADGEVVLYLDDGTYDVAITKTGYSFPSGTPLVVDGTETETYSMTANAVGTTGDADTVMSYLYTENESGAVAGIAWEAELVSEVTGTATGFVPNLQSGVSAANGLIQFITFTGAKYRATINGVTRRFEVAAAADDPNPLANQMCGCPTSS